MLKRTFHPKERTIQYSETEWGKNLYKMLKTGRGVNFMPDCLKKEAKERVTFLDKTMDAVNISSLEIENDESFFPGETDEPDLHIEFDQDDLIDDLSENSGETDETSPEARKWYNSNWRSRERNDWMSIYHNLRALGSVRGSVIWNDVRSLSLASFAVSQLDTKMLSGIKWTPEEEQRNECYRNLFTEMIDRAIELQPDNDGLRSSKAYSSYIHYFSRHKHDNDYQIAYDLLQELSQIPAVRYKDAQRFIKLRQGKLESTDRKERNVSATQWEGLAVEYADLVEIYDTLNTDEQNRVRKSLITCEYNYVKLVTDHLLDNVEYVYFSKLSPFGIRFKDREKVVEWINPQSEQNRERNELLKRCGRYMEELEELIPQDDEVSSVQNKNKVRFTELAYRKAKLLNIKGMLCEIVGVEREKNHYFADAGEELGRMFNKADSLIGKAARFNYPWYAVRPYAFAEFAQGHFREAVALILSVPQTVNPHNYYISVRNLLDVILPYIPTEMLFNNGMVDLHSVINYPLSEGMKQKLEAVIPDDEKLNPNSREILTKTDKVSRTEIMELLTDIYATFIWKQEFKDRQKSVKVIRSFLSEFVHYSPEHDEQLKNNEDRIKALYYLACKVYVNGKKNMTPAKHYIARKMCAEVFKPEMLEELKNISGFVD